jgi:glycolate oxidase
MTEDNQASQALISDLRAIVGESGLLTDAHSCSLYAQDVFTKDIPALAVAIPNNTEELSKVVKTATEAGNAVIPRGGGMSYTSGLIPINSSTIMVDMSRMNNVVEINQEDMYVTVECGCTWKALHEALDGTGLRTPYWGTLSGIRATVGGGLSQNAIFWGSGQYGTAADSVIGLEVVLSDGSVIKTGSGAQVNSTPFFRHFGPDLTGVFTCDNGALGFKAKATLRLIPELPAKEFIAFDFKKGEDAIGVMSEISRRGLAMECFGFDPYLQAQRLKRQGLTNDVKALAGVMKSAGSVMGALKDGAKIALAGRGYMDDVDYSVQIIVEERNETTAKALAEEIRALGAKFNGREIENSIPKITRANPFGPVNNMVGPEGERWVPVHGLFPHSKIQQGYQAVRELFEKHLLDKYEIGTGYLFATVSTNCFALEPVFFWPDAMTEIHEHSIEPQAFARLKGFPENLDAREAVKLVRADLAELFREMGAVHLQIGKSYRYKEGIQPQAWKLIQAIKDSVDPECKVNPQTLGLE